MMVDVKKAVETPSFITPDWPAPSNVRAAFTTRLGGYSKSPCDNFNLGLHVGDNVEHVHANRDLLIKSLSLPETPVYLNQIHGTDAICADDRINELPDPIPAADACWSAKNKVIAIMTADCLPVLFASKCGNIIAGAHAGWRGLADGVIEQTIAQLPVQFSELIAWLGPAIGPDKFEVGGEVKAYFVNQNASSEVHFKPVAGGKYFADLYGLARDRLQHAGISLIYGGDCCTHSDSSLFFSHRRDQGRTGRMAALIWKV